MIGQFYKSQYDCSESNLRKRTIELHSAAERLDSIIKRDLGDNVDVVLVPERLDTVISSYFYDLIRYKHFHGMLDEGQESKFNLQKIYSYTTKWILKEKPLYMSVDNLMALRSSSSELEKYLQYSSVINEMWAILWIQVSYEQQTGEEIALSSSPEDLYYVMKYREFSVAWFEEWLNNKFNHEILQQL